MSLRYREGLYIAPVVESCCFCLKTRKEIWNIFRPSGTSLSTYQFQAAQSGFFVGHDHETCSTITNIAMLPCIDPKTAWFSTSAIYHQSYWCYLAATKPTGGNRGFQGLGLYWSFATMDWTMMPLLAAKPLPFSLASA